MHTSKRIGHILTALILVTMLLPPAPASAVVEPASAQGRQGEEIAALASLGAPLREAQDSTQSTEAAKARALEVHGQLPLSFIPNQGQVDERVGYYVQSGGQSLWFTADGMAMALPETTLRLEFLGANPSARLEGGDKLPGIVNYFIGNDPSRWRTNIPTYGRITYRDLWPGVDLTYQGRPGALKSTFTIAPGADPAQIRLVYPDAHSLVVDGQGNLIIRANGEEVRESAPLAWQEIDNHHVPVAASYQVTGDGWSYNFALPEGYDPSYPLIIDPELIYSTFLGGSGGQTGRAVAIDGAGNAYVTGSTSSSDFPTTAGAFDRSCGTDSNCNFDGIIRHSDAFVVKLNAAGTGLIYATFLGGSDADVGHAIAVDGAGNAHVTGGTSSSNFSTTPGAFDTILSGYYDAFVVKLNATGTGLTYATFLGGNNDECVDRCAIAVDGTGSAYVTGDTLSSDFPTTVGAFDTSHNGAKDVFVVKLNAAGTGLAYATFLGGSGGDGGSAIAVNGAGNAYVTGATFSSNFPATPGAFDTSFGGGTCFEGPCCDAFVVKLDAGGTGLTYATFLGGSGGDDGGRAIAVDEAGSAYVTGVTSSSDFPTTPGAFDTSFGGGACFLGPCEDAFVVKLNAAGNGLAYATFLGGGDVDYSWAIAVDEAGSAYVVGETRSPDFPTTAGAFDTTCGTDGNCNPFLDDYRHTDAFVVKLKAAGTGLSYATFLGGSRSDYGRAIAVDGAGSAFVTGQTSSSDFPITAEAFDTSYNGGNDAFVARLAMGGGPELVGLEVTQAIQNLENSVVLIKDRPTFVRAHVRSTSGTVNDMTAELIGRRNGSELPGSPLRPANRGGNIDVLESPNRMALNDSFLFKLPLSWLSGTVELEFRGVNRSVACREHADTDNDCKVQVEFHETPEMEVRIVSVVWRDIFGTHRPGEDDTNQVIQEIESTFPIPSLSSDRGEWSLPWNGRPDDGEEFDDIDRINNQLMLMRHLDGCINAPPISCNRYYLGILADPPAFGKYVAGRAGGIPADVGTAYVVEGVPSHELGHMLGRRHTECTPDPNDEAGADNNYPYDDGHISQVDKGDNAFFGLDINTKRIYGPSTGDLMSYCEPNWPSDWTYSHIRDHLGSRYGTFSLSSSLALLVGDPAVLVSGVVTPTEGTGSLESVLTVESPASASAPEPGTHTIRFEDSGGQELASYSFEPAYGVDFCVGCADGGEDSVGTFVLLLPWNSSTARIVLLYNSQELDSRSASANAPTATVVSPNGGESLSGSTATLSWSASDLDGDPLEYVIQYSTDAGTNWQILASGWLSTTYEVSLDAIAGTDQGLVRVLASDGFHTFQDQSDGTFTVAKHPPQASIRTPANNSLYVGGQTIILEGSAFDNEDGQLGDSALSWSSSLDGALGTGRSLAVVASTLTEGTHTITLAAQDNDGQTDTTLITVQVYRERPTLPTSLAVAPTELSFLAVEGGGQTAWQTLAIRNDGDGTMTWSVAADQSWIVVSSLGGTAPTDIIVSADPTGLSVGEYTGNITITAPGAANSPQTAAVTLNVREPYRIYLPITLKNYTPGSQPPPPTVETLDFKASFQARDNADNRPHNVPIKVKIKNLSGDQFLFETDWVLVTPASSSDNWGTASVDVSSAGLTPGQSYQIFVKGAMHLAKQVTIPLTDGLTIDYTDPVLNPDGVLWACDVNQDNQVSNTDVSIVLSHYGATPTDPDPSSETYRSDQNGDGVVNSFDLAICNTNLGKVGD